MIYLIISLILLSISIVTVYILFYFLNKKMIKLTSQDVPFILKKMDILQDNDDILQKNDQSLLNRILIVERNHKKTSLYKSKHKADDEEEI